MAVDLNILYVPIVYELGNQQYPIPEKEWVKKYGRENKKEAFKLLEYIITDGLINKTMKNPAGEVKEYTIGTIK